MAIPGYKIFDAHMHFTLAYLSESLASYKDCGVASGINLSYPDVPGEYYAEFLKECRKRKLFGKFAQFYWPDWRVFGSRPGHFVKTLVKEMKRFKKLGASGLKVWKDIGMYDFHPDMKPSVMDDRRLNPVWDTAAELGWIISIHQADPTRGYMGGYTKNSRTGIPKEEIFERRDRVIAAHPEITFILCHNGNYMEDYKKLTTLFERFKNVHADMFGFSGPESKAEKAGKIEFIERFNTRVYLGQDLALPQDKPSDRPWNRDEYFGPLKKGLLDYGFSKETFENLTWNNGRRNIFGE